jgi:glycosyltransferase involved in cell wall biosynthesis
MKVLIANQVTPRSHFVYDINLIQMAYGIASLGHQVTLVGLQDKSGIVPQHEIDALYGSEPNLHWIQLGGALSRTLLTKSPRIFSWIGYRIAKSLDVDCVYARDYLFPWYCARGGISVFVEAHTNPKNSSHEFKKLIEASNLPSFKRFITISDVLIDGYTSRGVPKEKLLNLASGVDIKKFNKPAELPISPYSQNSYNVVYTGRLIDENGIPDIINAAVLLPDVNFHLVGGNIDDISRHEKTLKEISISNVILHGIKRHSDIPRYLWHADALLLPYSSGHQNDAWASPLKLFEYLASGTPIIATDTRMTRNWLTSKNALFVNSDDGGSMANGIKKMLSNKKLQTELSLSGPIKARLFSYDKRAQKMFDGCII